VGGIGQSAVAAVVGRTRWRGSSARGILRLRGVAPALPLKMKGENVLKVRKNVRGLWSAIGYANSHDENVLFRISLDFVVVEVSPREGGGGRVWCKTALVPNQELFLNPT
jgi:hypothetical protein